MNNGMSETTAERIQHVIREYSWGKSVLINKRNPSILEEKMLIPSLSSSSESFFSYFFVFYIQESQISLGFSIT